MDASGIVGFIKERKTAKGLKTFSFTLDDRDDDRWFGTYTDEPPAVGTFVTFEYVTNGAGFHNVDNKTMQATQPEEAEAAPAAAAIPFGGPAAAKAAYAKQSHKDANIQWQSARNAAIALLGVANDAGGLDLGTGKKGDKFAALTIMWNRLTVDLFEKSMEVGETGEVPADFQG